MSNHLYTCGAFLIAAAMVYGALQYTSNTPYDLSLSRTAMLATVSAHTFSQKNADEKRTIIDVRTREEYESSHIAGAVLIDIHDPSFAGKINALDKNAPYSVYCRSGNRSGQALSYMKANGFTDVIDLDGGVIAWQQQGKELCTDC